MPWQPLPGGDDRPPTPIRAGLDRLLDDLEAPRSGTVRSVFDDWSAIVGESLASRVRPVRLQRGRLTVAVDDPAWATQVRFLEPQLLARLAETFGPDEVTAIAVRVRRTR